MNINDRVKFTDKPFLSEGYILRIIEEYDTKIYVIKLDEKAPMNYAWDTDEVVSLDGSDLEVLS